MMKDNDDVSDQIQAFKAMKDHNKAQAKEHEDINTREIYEWCGLNGVHFKQLQPFHLRLMLDTLTVDIFPQSKKYHNIKTNSRGKIKGAIANFLNQTFL